MNWVVVGACQEAKQDRIIVAVFLKLRPLQLKLTIMTFHFSRNMCSNFRYLRCKCLFQHMTLWHLSTAFFGLCLAHKNAPPGIYSFEEILAVQF